MRKIAGCLLYLVLLMKDFIKKYSNYKIKRDQIILAATCVALFIISVVVFIESGSGRHNHESTSKAEDNIRNIEISKLAGGVSAEEKWLQNAESDIKTLEKKLEQENIETNALKEQIKNLEQIIEIFDSQRLERMDDDQSSEQLRAEVQLLKEEVQRLSSEQGSGKAMRGAEERIIKVHEIHLDGISSNIVNGSRHKLDFYMPAGSYSKAVLVSGIDASVGVNSVSDPRPVLLRLISKARSVVNDNEVQKIDVIGCTVTGAASGDLSSERAFIRLVKMTCSRQNGEVFETEVHGYVSSQGKAGIRGEVISREGDFVGKSFMAGLISGLGGGIAQSFGGNRIFFSQESQPNGMGDILSGGFAKGTQNSASRLADYLINRAEQYQPVISIPSGIEVEVVFNDGFYIDGRSNIAINK